MPYLFASLLLVNVIALGYFSFFHTPKPTQSFIDTKASLTQPVVFKNSSVNIPPLIGTKE